MAQGDWVVREVQKAIALGWFWLNSFNAEMSSKAYWQPLGRWGRRRLTLYTVTTRMTPAVRWAAMRAILKFD